MFKPTDAGKSIRILLVEDESLVRSALEALLSSWPGFQVVGETETNTEVVELVRRLDADVVLLSLGGIQDADLKLVRHLAIVSESVPVLVLMGDCPEEFRIQLIRHGARGVVLRRKPSLELRKAIEKLHQTDEIWLDRTALVSLITAVRPLTPVESAESELLPLLTGREREIVSFVIKGLKNKEVGKRLFISETTVRHHLTTIFNKLNISSRFELIAYIHAHQNSGVRGGEFSRLQGVGSGVDNYR